MDMSTKYLGFDLAHPFISGACPLADQLDTIRLLEDSGAAAIVLRSLFEEQLIGEGLATHRSMDHPSESFAEAITYFPSPEEFVLGPDEYLEHLHQAKEAVDIPVIASLNGTTPGGWLDYSRLMEEAGADAIELHIYSVPTDPNVNGDELEQRTVEMVGAVKETVRIPVALKLSPFYTAFANLASRLDDAGADGLVLFNRFYHSNIDVEELEVVTNFSLSTSAELPLRLRWLALVSGRVRASLAVTGGVHTAVDAIKSIMCGANAVQMVSALLLNGPQYLGVIRRDVEAWMEENEYDSLRQMCGSMSLLRCPNPMAFNRADYMRVLQTYEV